MQLKQQVATLKKGDLDDPTGDAIDPRKFLTIEGNKRLGKMITR
jgi:hypothetical protein